MAPRRIDLLEGCEGAARSEGHVVIIDVLRAFTTAAYAFAAGIEIEFVETPESPADFAVRARPFAARSARPSRPAVPVAVSS